ncbi:MAG: M48 family metallopeptidase [Alphaproteobacteria bacterium]|nr:M48 family metallopeptidase [Alphaproteobacteria bacterium]NCQ67104.1 M48 family metallopeptidase [Alphaproteobacteria bacterium]NCT07701.1 M48 family metallopeptidase [Alphaproteobacteria bacterium]
MTDFIHRLNDQNISVRLSRNKRSKRMSLRFDSIKNVLNLTAPPRVSQKQMLGFLERTEGWILKQVSRAITSVPFEKNAVISVLDIDYKIKHQSLYGRLDVKMQDGSITVYGPEERINMMVTIFLKRHAKSELERYCEQYAVAIGMAVNKVTIRDTKSRWGSCSEEGNISLCWRLLLAPKSVAAYVCAHEVAHLKEMNHSPTFWKIVEDLHPEYKDSKAWLKKNGRELFKYGLGH